MPEQTDNTTTVPPSSLVRKLAGLPNLTNAQLHQLWRDLYKREPPKLSRPHLIRLFAWRIQELACGGLEPEVRDRLKRSITTFRARGRIPGKIIKPKVGVLFDRLWRGRRYVVVVRENSFEWEGRIYRSLTAIAKVITGNKTMSGPRFFGLEDAGYERKR